MIVVSNASPLIILARLGLFELTKYLFKEIIISQEVWNEVVIKGAGLPGSEEAQQGFQSGWVHVRPIAKSDHLTVWKNQYNLGAGELATIILAREIQADLALMDERRARNLALYEGVKVLGSIGIIELGYLKGEVSELRQIYHKLL
ncbi:MAG: DUF3368 domain-containing protein [Acidobacteria bacterium]|nr:DUF3368 domain-containing protein [Acidobacteriota bacterium]